MRSRTLREGSVGLLILAGIGLFGGLVLWLRGINPGARSYRLQVELQDASGVDVGSAVRFRGVKVGSVTGLETATNSVIAEVAINSGELLIPRQAIAETTQSGFIGQVFIDFRPPATLVSATLPEGLSPFPPNCDSSRVLCDGDRLKGQTGASFDELIRSTTAIAELLDNSNLIANANRTLLNADRTLTRFSTVAGELTTAARGVNQLTRTAQGELKNFSVAANSVTQAANEVSDLVQANRGTIASTLTNLDASGQELRTAISNLSPFLSRLEKSQLLANLETLAANGAKASANLKDLTTTLNNPITVLGLAQTLDAARTTFLNTQKITTDLDRITGDATFRANLIKLINGLSKLVSSSQELERQLQALETQTPNPQPPSQTTTTPSSTPVGGLPADRLQSKKEE
uniref:Mammalian cell entry related domain protein n=1 Tax=Cyanothece sp. (strain PCC 7425 / ATCC 29141) TaxID=395961 RepID=B8HTP7_CYAP4